MTDKWYNSYRWWWSRIGGRKWTWIVRDARQKYPTPWMLGVMVVSAVIGHYFWSWWLLAAFGVLLIGILWGHLWFGTKYIPNQGADKSMMQLGESPENWRKP